MDVTHSCTRCGYNDTGRPPLFCPDCGLVLDGAGLRTVRLAGAIGVRHASSPALDAFWSTGEASVFDDPKLKGRRNHPV